MDVVGRDLATLQAAGVDGVLFCNEHDIPYHLEVGQETVERWRRSSASCAGIRVPFGVNILWDARASLAVARATGARSSARS